MTVSKEDRSRDESYEAGFRAAQDTNDFPSDAPGGPMPGRDTFPGYEVVRELQRGAQGVVYQAIQLSTKRKVAIKVLDTSRFHGEADLARFEREIYILAQMRHPNIVRIFDSGRTPADAIFYVMDYIPGKTLDNWIKEHPHPPIPSTLRMFVKLCTAVREVHLRAVIHRDIKPTNIKITPEGDPILLDFGYARPVLGDLLDDHEVSDESGTGVSILSVPWSSPEQAEGSAFDVDVRTDVHALGLVLYHILTGRFPYGVTGGLADVLRNIAAADPVPPSRIRADIDPDLEAIILKCLRKRREDRYQSAGRMAEDIEHYLNGEPISARPPSLWLQARSLHRRNRIIVNAVILVTIALVLGLISTLWALRRAQISEREALAKERSATLSSRFLCETLLSANPFASGDTVAAAAGAAGAAPSVYAILAAPGRYAGSSDRPIQVVDLLKDAGRRLLTEFQDDPDLRATLAVALGTTLNYYDQYELSGKLLDDVIRLAPRLSAGHQHLVIEAKLTRGWQMAFMSQNPKAETLLREGYDAAVDAFGPADPRTLSAAIGYAINHEAMGSGDDAVAFLEQRARESARKLGEDHVAVLQANIQIAKLKARTFHIDESARIIRESLTKLQAKLPREDPNVLAAVSDFVRWSSEYAPTREAEDLAREAVALRASFSGPDDLATLQARDDLIVLLTARRRYQEALPLAAEVAGARLSRFGTRHRQTIYANMRLARIGIESGQHAETALQAARNCRDGLIDKQFDPDDGDLHKCASLIGWALVVLERYDEAAPTLSKLAEDVRSSPKSYSKEMIPWACSSYAACLIGQGKLDAARQQLKVAEAEAERRYGKKSSAWRRVAEVNVALAGAAHHDEDAKRWQAEIASYDAQ